MEGCSSCVTEVTGAAPTGADGAPGNPGTAAGKQRNREPRAPRGDKGDKRAGAKPEDGTKGDGAKQDGAPAFTSAKSRKAAKEAAAASKTAAVKSKRGKLAGFGHLPLSIYDQFALDADVAAQKRAQVASLHGSFLACLQQLVQSNLCVTRRTELLLNACKEFVAAYIRPSDKAFSWHVNELLAAQLETISAFQPLAPGLQHAVRFLRASISRLPPESADADAKAAIAQSADEYLRDRVQVTGSISSIFASSGALKLMAPGASVVVVGDSILVAELIKHAHAKNTQGKLTDVVKHEDSFTVTVVDTRPFLSGKAMLDRLTPQHIPCKYAQISSLQTALTDASVVLLQAEAVDVAGNVLASSGSALVAQAAALSSVPAYVIAPTYTFTESRVSAVAANAFAPSTLLVDAQATLPALSSLGTTAPPPPKPVAPKPAAAASKTDAVEVVIQPWRSTGSFRGDSVQEGCVANDIAGWASSRHLHLLCPLFDVTTASTITAYLTEVGELKRDQLAIVLQEFGRLETVDAEEDDGDASDGSSESEEEAVPRQSSAAAGEGEDD